jgi:hypothetical protein
MVRPKQGEGERDHVGLAMFTGFPAVITNCFAEIKQSVITRLGFLRIPPRLLDEAQVLLPIPKRRDYAEEFLRPLNSSLYPHHCCW